MARSMAPARRAAKDAGETFYHGPACRYGHVGERYASTNACRQCVADKERERTRGSRARKPAAAPADFDTLLRGN